MWLQILGCSSPHPCPATAPVTLGGDPEKADTFGSGIWGGFWAPEFQTGHQRRECPKLILKEAKDNTDTSFPVVPSGVALDLKSQWYGWCPE